VSTEIADAVAQAVAVFQAHPAADDETIDAALRARGIDERLVVRLIQFLPSAFCRVLLAPQGVRFRGQYVVMGPRGKDLGTYELADEPVFVEATIAARRELETEHGRQTFPAIAWRSSECKAVYSLVEQGEPLEAIICAALILHGMGDDYPPGAGAPASASAPVSKPWWQRWRR
jgi:hypothetical protein